MYYTLTFQQVLRKFFVMKIPCLLGAVTTTCKTHLLNQPCILFKRKRTEALQHDKCIQQGRSKEINKTNNIPCRDPSESTKMTTPKLTKMLSVLQHVLMTVKDFQYDTSKTKKGGGGTYLCEIKLQIVLSHKIVKVHSQ